LNLRILCSVNFTKDTYISFRTNKDSTRQRQVKKGRIRKQLKVQSVQNKIDEYGQNWMNHLDRMADEIIPKHIPQYKIEGAETEENLENDGMSM
jgi:hypothetical protein